MTAAAVGPSFQGYSQLGSAVRFCGCQTRKKQKLTNQASSKYISLPLAGGNCFICQFCPKLFCSSLLNTPQFDLRFSQLRCLAGKRSALFACFLILLLLRRPVTLSYYLLSRNLDFLMDFPLLFCIYGLFSLNPEEPELFKTPA